MKNTALARKLTALVPLALSGTAMLLVSLTTTTVIAVALIAIAVTALTAASQSIWALEHELVPGKYLGGVSGFIHLLSNISGIVGPAIMGFAVQYLGGYSSGFALGATVDLIGVLAMIFFVRTRQRTAMAGIAD
jgi:predicted MFS family arabinose efflux permease